MWMLATRLLTCLLTCLRCKALIYMGFMGKGDKETSYMMIYAHMQCCENDVTRKNTCMPMCIQPKQLVSCLLVSFLIGVSYA